MSSQISRLASRYIKKVTSQLPCVIGSVVLSSVKLDSTTRSRINNALERTGLNGNGRYDRAQRGYAEAVDILANFGIELDGIVNSFEFTRPKGRVTVELAFTNQEDSFSPISIGNAMLVVQFERLRENAYEVIAYVS